MGRIFISHSHENNAEVVAIRDWLLERGWSDLFLDFDPRVGIGPGAEWEGELYKAAATCDLFLFLFSSEWLASDWCRGEYTAARIIRKPLLGVVIDDTDSARLPLRDRQIIRLRQPPLDWTRTVKLPRSAKTGAVAFSNAGLDELAQGIRAAEIDATYFAWPPKGDPDRSPYPGFRPLEAEDAGIFFGRDGDLSQALYELQDLHGRSAPRVATILGASGAGKSSFLRAGLLPRLDRDSRRFLTLRPVRPAPAAMTGEEGFVAVLHKALGKRGVTLSLSKVANKVAAGAAGTAELIGMLCGNAADHPMVVVSVDQAEELLNSAGGDNGEAAALLELLVTLAREPDSSIMLILCVRSDRFDGLQKAVNWGDGTKPHLIDLSPIPIGRYGEIILAPAARLTAAGRTLVVDDLLVQAVLRDIQKGAGADALPLLAFILERLFKVFLTGDTMRLEDYRDPPFNGMTGAIASAVDEALKNASSNPDIPRARDAQLQLLRRGLIPWLASIDPDSRTARRRVAKQSEVPPEALPLMLHLVDQHLLIAGTEKVDKEAIVGIEAEAGSQTKVGDPTIEPSHEALLRQWGLLKDWLEEDELELAQIEGVRRAAGEWEANGRGRDFLVHDGARLDVAIAALADERTKFPNYVRDMDRDYVRASRWARVKRRIAGVAAALVALTIGGLVYLELNDKERAKNASHLVAASEVALREGDDLLAVSSARAALQMRNDPVTRTAAAGVLMQLSPNLVGLFRPSGRIDDVAWGSASGPVLIWHAGAGTSAGSRYLQQIDVSNGNRVGVPVPLDQVAHDAFTTADGIGVVARDGGAVAQFDFAGKPSALLAGRPGFQPGAQQIDTSSDARVIALVSNIGEVLVRVCADDCVDQLLTEEAAPAKSVALTPDGSRLAVGREDGAIDFYDAPFEKPFLSLPGAGPVAGIDWSPDRGFLAVGREGKPVDILTVRDGLASSIVALRDSTGNGPLQWAPVGQTLAATCNDVDLCIYQAPKGASDKAEIIPSHVLAGHRTRPVSLAWNASATELASFGLDANDGLRIWSVIEDRERGADLAAAASADLTSLAVDRSRDIVAAGDADGAIWIWHASGQRQVIPRPATIETTDVSSLAFLANGDLAAVYENTAIQVWRLGEIPAVMHSWVPDEQLDFSRIEAFGQGRGLVSPLSDGGLVVFDGSAFGLGEVGDEAFGVAASVEGDAVFLSLADGSIGKRDPLGSGEAVSVVKGQAKVCNSPPPKDNGARSLDVSPDGRLLVAARTDAIVAVYRANPPNQEVHCVQLDDGDQNSITVAFSTDSRALAVLTSAQVSVFDLEDTKVPFVLGARTASGATGSSATWVDWYDADRLLLARGNRVVQLNLHLENWRKRMDSVLTNE